VTGLVFDRRQTLELVRQVSLAGQGDVSLPVLLGRVCAVVSGAFDFDHVAAARYDDGAGEVTEIACAGAPSADRAERRPIASVPLLAQARATEDLVFAADAGGLAFALPLISAGGCRGFLSGEARRMVPPDGSEVEALTTAGVVVATVLEHALAREELEAADVLKSEFIALAAHELRNPLSSIYWISVTMDERGDALPESKRLELQKALGEQATRMRSLVEQLLDLSRFDLAAIHVSPEPVRLRPKIEEVVRSLAAVRPGAVRIAVPADLEAVVDPVALDGMLSNMVANALRHGEPPVTVTAAQHDMHLRLAVEDRGKGIRREFVPRLFDRFTRRPESRGRSDGSGLGLAIAKAYARAHGGDIVYAPAVPHGARFEAVIPLPRRGSDRAAIDSLHAPSSAN
jgi:signal transduction histidine kinase